MEEQMDHVMTRLEWEEDSFCEVGDAFVEVIFARRHCVADGP